MTLRSRLACVERALSSVRITPQCPTCGFPRHDLKHVPIVRGPEPVRRCSTCRMDVDASGGSLYAALPDGRVVLNRILLCKRHGAAPRLPVEEA